MKATGVALIAGCCLRGFFQLDVTALNVVQISRRGMRWPELEVIGIQLFGKGRSCISDLKLLNPDLGIQNERMKHKVDANHVHQHLEARLRISRQ